MVITSQSKTEKINGSQGCVNFGQGCDYVGFYLAKYSQEGLCFLCELKSFPDRFYGCVCCGRPVRAKMVQGVFQGNNSTKKIIKHTLFCHSCKNQFSEWLFDLFYNKNEQSKSTNSCFASRSNDETNDWRLWSIIQKGTDRIVNHLSTDNFPIREYVEPRLNDSWPGFHIGENKYTDLDPFEFKSCICIDDIAWNNSEKIMLRELEKINIYPHAQIQIKK